MRPFWQHYHPRRPSTGAAAVPCAPSAVTPGSAPHNPTLAYGLPRTLPAHSGFRDFILRGDVVSLAVAVVVGGSFSALVRPRAAPLPAQGGAEWRRRPADRAPKPASRILHPHIAHCFNRPHEPAPLPHLHPDLHPDPARAHLSQVDAFVADFLTPFIAVFFKSTGEFSEKTFNIHGSIFKYG
jgi:hypothetical protein